MKSSSTRRWAGRSKFASSLGGDFLYVMTGLDWTGLGKGHAKGAAFGTGGLGVMADPGRVFYGCEWNELACIRGAQTEKDLPIFLDPTTSFSLSLFTSLCFP